MKIFILMSLVVGLCDIASAVDLAAVRNHVKQHETEILSEFMDFVSLPNVATDRENIQGNAKALLDIMQKHGIQGRLLTDSDGPPAVYGEIMQPGATRTIVFYAHYDGQPVVPDQWTVTPPFKPILAEVSGGLKKITPVKPGTSPLNPEWRVYGRSTSDDKLGVMSILNAIDTLRALSVPVTSNIKLFFEGEEEQGSPHLSKILAANRFLLRADLWIFVDGPEHSSGRTQLSFGVRGGETIDLVMYGPKRPLHSGHYGNWAPNPAMDLARLLGSMEDDDGKVLVKGFYDDVVPLTKSEKKASESYREFDRDLAKDLLIAKPDGRGKPLLNLLTQPSLNIRGITSAEAMPGSNVIPADAKASLDIRLVKGDDYRRQFNRIEAHAKAHGYYVVNRDPSDSERLEHPKVIKITMRDGAYNAARISMDAPFSDVVTKAVDLASKNPVALVTNGGSLPLYLFHEILGAQAIMVSFANHDNNQHAENENVRLQNFWDGIAIVSSLLTM